jgi:glucose/arabinose dehydrogenase
MKITMPSCTLLLALCQTAQAADPTFHTSAGDVTISSVGRGLEYPWSLAFMPDGEMLVTERPGRMRIVARDGRVSPRITGIPAVFAQGQSGLEDVILARDFAKSHTLSSSATAKPPTAADASRSHARSWSPTRRRILRR